MYSDATDWNERYRDGDTPWDTNRPSTELVRVLGEWSITPGRVLEIGCGTGTNAVYLAQQGYQVTAQDLSPRAIEQAKARAAREGALVDFLTGDVLELADSSDPFPFVFDRGVYHIVRQVDVERFVDVMSQLTAPGGLYLALAGNDEEPNPTEGGPPRVSVRDICHDFDTGFQIVQLREFYFDPIQLAGQTARPLAWSILLRRRT